MGSRFFSILRVRFAIVGSKTVPSRGNLTPKFLRCGTKFRPYRVSCGAYCGSSVSYLGPRSVWLAILVLLLLVPSLKKGSLGMCSPILRFLDRFNRCGCSQIPVVRTSREIRRDPGDLNGSVTSMHSRERQMDIADDGASRNRRYGANVVHARGKNGLRFKSGTYRTRAGFWSNLT
jgi:hypothetical protein